MLTKSIASFFVVGIAFSAMLWSVIFKVPFARRLVRAHKAKSFMGLEILQSVFHGVSTPSAIAINAGGTVANALVLFPWAILDVFHSKRAN